MQHNLKIMKNKNFKRFLLIAIAVSFLVIIIFRQNKPETIQNIVTSTHQQFINFQDNLRDAERKTLNTDEKYLKLLGFNDNPHLYPKDQWKNTTLPVIVTYVREGQESQAVGLVNNVGRILPNNTILVYNLDLGNYALKTLMNYCNNSRCQVLTFPLNEFPSHISEENLHAFRPLIIQDALDRTGAVFFLECHHRLARHISPDFLNDLFESTRKGSGALAWPYATRNPVSSLTHKKMFEYFHTDAENFYFLQMVNADALILFNTKQIHHKIMLPWCECSLTPDCIAPIGAQSAGCRFDKKPQYRYSGCHNYDASALNIVLGLVYKYNSTSYSYAGTDRPFDSVDLSRAVALLKEYEQNTTTDSRFQQFDTT